MPRKNPRGVSRKGKPDNQQERLEIANWICGFVDGEGCFSVSLIRNSTTGSGWQVFPEFVVTQGEKSLDSLKLIQSFFECGRIYPNRRHDNHKENLLRYCVRSQNDLREKVIPFFQKHQLRTAKSKDFEKFMRILDQMEKGLHKTDQGLKKIAQLIQSMNRKVPSRFLKSSETRCQTPDLEKI